MSVWKNKIRGWSGDVCPPLWTFRSGRCSRVMMASWKNSLFLVSRINRKNMCDHAKEELIQHRHKAAGLISPALSFSCSILSPNTPLMHLLQCWWEFQASGELWNISVNSGRWDSSQAVARTAPRAFQLNLMVNSSLLAEKWDHLAIHRKHKWFDAA